MVDRTLKQICPTCGKPTPGGRRSPSLTGFMFSGAECTCNSSGAKTPGKHSRGQNRGGPRDSMEPEIDFCPRCGLQVVSGERVGSFTAFLFQNTRCKCPPDKNFADGQMSDRFWRLKQAGAGTMFVSGGGQRAAGAKTGIELAPGAIIGGVYEIISQIGQGGMGEVYLARHTGLGKKCALKVIPPEQVTEVGWQRFQMEADPPTLASALPGTNFPPAMEIVIAKVLRKLPAERYQSLGQLKADLERVLAGKEVQPVYIPRETVARAPLVVARKESRGESTGPRQTVHPGVITIGLIGLVLATLAIGATVFFSNNSKKVIGAASLKLDDNTGLSDLSQVQDQLKAPKPGANSGPYFRGVIVVKDKRLRDWAFPRTMGERVILQTPKKIYRVSSSTATHLQIPADEPLCLHVLPLSLATPEVLKGFSGGGFDELNLGHLTLQETRAALPYFSRLECVTRLRIGNRDWSEYGAHRGVEFVDQFPRLTRLSMGFAVDAIALGRVTILPYLSSLSLESNQPDLHRVLKVIAMKGTLKELAIDMWTCDDDDLLLLSKLSDLQSLSISPLMCTHKQVVNLSSIAGLRDLKVGGMRYRKDLAADLKLLKSLKTLETDSIGMFSREQYDSMVRALPGVKVTDAAIEQAEVFATED